MSDCIFCKIVAGEIPAHKVYEDDQTLAFMDIGQVNPGHVIVALKPHAETLFDVSQEQAGVVFETVHKVAAAVRSAFSPEGLTVLQANGKAGWQTIAHFHLHVLPRHTDDGVALTWPAKNPPQEELAALAARIRV